MVAVSRWERVCGRWDKSIADDPKWLFAGKIGSNSKLLFESEGEKLLGKPGSGNGRVSSQKLLLGSWWGQIVCVNGG